MDEPRHCSATRRDGSPCAAPPSAVDAATGFCWAHSPDKREARRAARAEKLLPSHMRPVLAAVFAALRDVRSGAIAPAQASAIASLAGAAVKVYQAGLLEERIAALEQAGAVATAPQEGQGRT